jgi:hypothetical protein
MNRVAVTSAWTLCHEDLLKQVLLDKAFLDGFEGARVLEVNAEFEEITKQEASDEVQAYVDSILLSYDTLLASVDAVKGHLGEQMPNVAAALGGPQGIATVTACGVSQDRLRQALFMAMLATDTLAWSALKKLKQDIRPSSPPSPPPAPRKAIDALRDFLAVVTPSSYRPHVNASLTTGLHVIGISPPAFIPLLAWGFLVMQPDDAGLFVSVKAADKKLKAMAQSSEDQASASPEKLAVMDLAKAGVSFEALKCHIEDNWVYYLQSMWKREESDQRFLRLQSYGATAAILENAVIGFLGHKAAFPIVNLEALLPQVDFKTIIDQTPAEEPTAPQLITLPTSGALLEAMVGECDACEEFIRKSRLIDLRLQEAKAAEEESEATRYAKRIEGGDYSDPKTLSTGQVVITVGAAQSPPTV